MDDDISELGIKLRKAAWALETPGVRSMRLQEAKAIVLAALDDMDRAANYGNPGRGIDELLGTKEKNDG